jgi:nucleoside-diphosphate-sugar epimerase
VRHLIADRTNPTSLEREVGSELYDAVYDMIAYDAVETEAAIRIFQGRTGRFIHCSTVSVYMVSDQVRCPITEDQDHTPLMPYFDRNPFGMEYGIKKRRCEEALWRAHDNNAFPVTIMRPTFISGPGDPAQRDWFWIQRILDGRPLLVPGSGRHVFQQVYVEDVARAFAALVDAERTIGMAYNVAAEEAFSLNRYLDELAGLLGTTASTVHLEQEAFDALPISTSTQGDVFPFNVRRTAVFSLDAIKRDLNYHSTRFDTWMTETIRWWCTKGRGDSNGYDRRAEELSIIHSLPGG